MVKAKHFGQWGSNKPLPLTIRFSFKTRLLLADFSNSKHFFNIRMLHYLEDLPMAGITRQEVVVAVVLCNFLNYNIKTKRC